MNWLRPRTVWHTFLSGMVLISSGCHIGVKEYYFLGKPKPHQEQYREATLEVDHSDITQPTPAEVETTAPPHTVADLERDEVWDLSLQEAIHTALGNSDVLRSAGQFLSPGNTLLANPNNAASVYDPAIQNSGVLFGGVGTEAALAEFDATLSSSFTYGRNETVQNNPFFGGVQGGVLEQDTGAFDIGVTKQFAYGASFDVTHSVDYLSTNANAVLFPSVYSGDVQATYRHQLLAGAGPEFVRVAGPLNAGFANITGVANGVLIARINADISIAQFEANVRNLIKDVEDTYWDLYLAYRNFDTSVTARNTALDTWRVAKAKRDLGGVRGFTNSEEAQARDRYFETRAQAESSLGNLYVTEQRLRNLLGLPINDRKVIRPADHPIAARLHADWYHSLALGLTERVELRSQKWNIKSLELQLGAAKNFARPRLDFVARYRVNGFGDHLLGNNDRDVAGGDLNTFYHKVAEGEETGYDLGLEFNMPFGLRLAKTQVQNIELRLTKARKVLAAQELEIGHELAVAFQQLETSYATAVSNYSRRNAAIERFRMIGQELEVGSGSNTLDRFLRAQESAAAASNAYHQSLVEYNKAIVNLYYRQGTLLQEDNIHLMEGKWHPEAYRQAYARAKARAHAIPAPHLKTVPAPFAADGHLQEVGFAAPEAQSLSQQGDGDEMIMIPYPEELPLPIDPNMSEETLPEEATDSELPQAPASQETDQETLPEIPDDVKQKYFEDEPSSDAGTLELILPEPSKADPESTREASLPGKSSFPKMDAIKVAPTEDASFPLLLPEPDVKPATFEAEPGQASLNETSEIQTVSDEQTQQEGWKQSTKNKPAQTGSFPAPATAETPQSKQVRWTNIGSQQPKKTVRSEILVSPAPAGKKSIKSTSAKTNAHEIGQSIPGY